jgi:hypothetical protein
MDMDRQTHKGDQVVRATRETFLPSYNLISANSLKCTVSIFHMLTKIIRKLAGECHGH